MKFAIDIKAALSIRKSGIGNYVFNLVENLIQIDNKNEYYLIVPNSIFKNPFNLTSNFHFKNRYNLFTRLKILDVVHGPDFKLPLTIAKKKIITIHDLASFSDQNFMSKKFKELTKEKVIRAIKSKSIIITVSNSIKNQLENDFPSTRGRIINIHHGINKNITFVADEKFRSFVKSKYNLPESFLLFVGNLENRKNIITLLKAIKYLRDEFRSSYKLVLVGKGGWGFESINKFIIENNLVENVKIIGWIEDKDLYIIYSLAELFVFPSFYEGFGLPIIEAMKCKLPVILSDIPVHREIAEDAAYFFSTTNVEELAHCILLLINDENQKNILVKKAMERSKYFDWNKTAKETLKIYENISD